MPKVTSHIWLENLLMPSRGHDKRWHRESLKASSTEQSWPASRDPFAIVLCFRPQVKGALNMTTATGGDIDCQSRLTNSMSIKCLWRGDFANLKVFSIIFQQDVDTHAHTYTLDTEKSRQFDHPACLPRVCHDKIFIVLLNFDVSPAKLSPRNQRNRCQLQ